MKTMVYTPINGWYSTVLLKVDAVSMSWGNYRKIFILFKLYFSLSVFLKKKKSIYIDIKLSGVGYFVIK